MMWDTLKTIALLKIQTVYNWLEVCGDFNVPFNIFVPLGAIFLTFETEFPSKKCGVIDCKYEVVIRQGSKVGTSSISSDVTIKTTNRKNHS